MPAKALESCFAGNSAERMLLPSARRISGKGLPCSNIRLELTFRQVPTEQLFLFFVFRVPSDQQQGTTIGCGLLRGRNGARRSDILRLDKGRSIHAAKSDRDRRRIKGSFAKAAENAVAEAAKTVRGMKWARVAEFEIVVDGKKIVEYRATARIYFEIER